MSVVNDESTNAGLEPGTPEKKTWVAVVKTFLVIGLVGLGLYLLPLLVGMGVVYSALAPTPIPLEQRYSQINDLLEEIDYKSSGTVTEESYSEAAAHPINPAVFRATIEGEDTYEVLKARILEATEGECGVTSEGNISCPSKAGRPSMYLQITGDGIIDLMITDRGTNK